MIAGALMFENTVSDTFLVEKNVPYTLPFKWTKENKNTLDCLFSGQNVMKCPLGSISSIKK